MKSRWISPLLSIVAIVAVLSLARAYSGTAGPPDPPGPVVAIASDKVIDARLDREKIADARRVEVDAALAAIKPAVDDGYDAAVAKFDQIAAGFDALYNRKPETADGERDRLMAELDRQWRSRIPFDDFKGGYNGPTGWRMTAPPESAAFFLEGPASADKIYEAMIEDLVTMSASTDFQPHMVRDVRDAYVLEAALNSLAKIVPKVSRTYPEWKLRNGRTLKNTFS